MKEDARGPFASIKWFCKDGRVLAPQDFTCAKKGEGWQHGEWSDRTKQLRSQGYKVANVLAGIDATRAVAEWIRLAARLPAGGYPIARGGVNPPKASSARLGALNSPDGLPYMSNGYPISSVYSRMYESGQVGLVSPAEADR